VCIEKFQLPDEQFIGGPGETQGIDNLAPDTRGKFFLLENRADFFALLSLIAATAIQVKSQVQHQTRFFRFANDTTDIVTVLGGELQIEIGVTGAHRAQVIGLRRGNIILGNPHGGVIGQGLVDQIIDTVLGDGRQFGLAQPGRIDITAKHLVQLRRRILEVILLRDHTCLGARQASLCLL